MPYQITNTPATLYDAVRAAFVGQNTTLSKWCKANDVSLETARQTLAGLRRGEEADKLRKRIMRAAGVVESDRA